MATTFFVGRVLDPVIQCRANFSLINHSIDYLNNNVNRII